MSRVPALVSLIVFVFLAGCTTVHPIEQVLRIDTELVEGTSTKADVLRLMGKPTGSGDALLPPDFELQEIWYYFESKVTNARAEGRVVRADASLQIIGIFFRAGRYDGYWFTGTGVEGGEFDLRDLELRGLGSP
jgi:hypothetical protein